MNDQTVMGEAYRIARLLQEVDETVVMPCLVGGCVRDALIAHPTSFQSGLALSGCKDYDMEVFGLSFDQLVSVLGKHYELDMVGKCFKVIKIKGLPIDIAPARRETRTGPGHKDYEVVDDATMTLVEAAKRRDFTINAIYYDLIDKDIMDPFRGVAHLKARIIHPVSERCKEDALRVYRAGQFIARFDLTPTWDCARACMEMRENIRHLPKERILEEWKKLLLKGWRIGKGLEFLRDTGVLADYHPELQNLNGVEQEPEWHPEGDVWTHTMHCLDHIRNVFGDNEEDNLAVAFAVLGHDFGKVTHTVKDPDSGRITSPGHEAASGPLIRNFMSRMFDPAQSIVGLVEKLAVNHMRPVAIHSTGGTLSALRRCSVAVDGRLDLLLKVVECDQCGRPPKAPNLTATHWVKKIIEEALLEASKKPQPIVMGRHLIEHFNLKPGPDFSVLLDYAFESQLDGKFGDLESGLKWLEPAVRAKLQQKA